MKIKSITKHILDSPKQFYDVINANPHNNFLIKTNTGYIGSHNCFCDEISFQNNSDVEKQKKKAMQLVSSANARMQSRFMRGEKNPTLLLLASSKRTEQSFLETFIDNKKKNESKSTLIIDEPQWVIRTDKDSPNKFKVAVGNKFLSSEVLPLNISDQDLQIYRDKGFQILDVPMGYYENFIDDIDIALTDIAGISTTSSSRYIAGPRIAAIKTKDYKNPFTKEIITVGNGKNDTTQYSDFFDLNLVDPKLKSRPLYIHLDMSISGDKTGIAGVWIVGKKLPKAGQPESKDLIYQLAFSVSVKAPKGHQVSFEKNRQFIYWLKENGFNIRGTSSDTFQSYDTGQALKNKGFNYDIISVDRTKDNVCIPYQYLKSTIYEERLIMYENTLLTEELIGLERNNNSGKVDHSPSGINCFTGDTKVSLLDGRNLSMLELIDEFKSGKSNYVYSFNHTSNKIEPALIKKAWCSGHNAKLLEVTLDNNKIIRCTPEHRFMLRDGSYKEAKYLTENESLMPLYTRFSNKGLDGYRLYYEPMENAWHYEHKQFNPNTTRISDVYKSGRIVSWKNHKVKSIKLLNYTEDVYDLEIDKNHNFALSCGIFVHNSKDQADAVCGAVYNASQHAEEYALEYGESLEGAILANTSNNQENDKKQITLDFEQELTKIYDNRRNKFDGFTDFGLGKATTYGANDFIIL